MTQSNRLTLRELSPSVRVQGPFSISNTQLGRTRNDKPYLRCLLGDSSGQVPGRMWSIEESTFESLPREGFVWIEGETQAYQGELQLIIHSINAIEPTPEQLRDLMPSSARPAAEMFEELVSLLGNIKHPAMKTLVQTYLEDEYLMDQFRTAPAAKSMHHAYLGGLLEHTLALVKLAYAVCPLYPRINQDIVVVGLFLHDLGKTRELAFESTFTYTDRGELVGHIVEGAIMLHDKAQTLMREKGVRLPGSVLTVLQHIILSHHGVPEFGAAKIPSTPEAILVSLLDNVDAKTTIALEAARPAIAPTADLGGNFTEKQWALDTKLYKPDPLGT